MQTQGRPKRSKAVGIVKVLIKKHLYWLAGYPTDSTGKDRLQWVYLNKDGSGDLLSSLEITSKHLHKATFTLKKIEHEFPNAYKEAVERPGTWLNETKSKIEAAKERFHSDGNSEKLFEWRDSKLGNEIEDFPKLQDWIIRSTWIFEVLNESQLTFVKRLRESAGAFEVALMTEPELVGSTLTSLLDTSETVPVNVFERILQILGEPDSWIFLDFFEKNQQYVEDLFRPLRTYLDQLPNGELVDKSTWPKIEGNGLKFLSQFFDLLRQLIVLNLKRKRLGVQLVNDLLPERQLESFREWNEELRKKGAVIGSHKNKEMGKDLQVAIDELKKAFPKNYNFEDCKNFVQIGSKQCSPVSLKFCVGFFNETPEIHRDVPLRYLIVQHWIEVEKLPYIDAKMEDYCDLIQSLIDSGVPQSLIWRIHADGSSRYSLEEMYYDDKKCSKGQLIRFCNEISETQIESLVGKRNNFSGIVSSALNVYVASGSMDFTFEWIKEIEGKRKSELYWEFVNPSLPILKLTKQIVGEDVKKCVDFFRSFYSACHEKRTYRYILDSFEKTPQFESLFLKAAALDLKAELRRLIQLIDIGLKSGSSPNLDSLHIGAKEVKQSDWMSEYPEEFRASLKELQSVDGLARQYAERRLGKYRFSSESIRAEIENLEKRSSDASIKQRIANLNKHLVDGPQNFGDESIQDALSKINRKIVLVQIQDLAKSLLDGVTTDEIVVTLLGDEQLSDLAGHILGLKGWAKSLGLECLKRSLEKSEGPEDLSDREENQYYIQLMKERGINPEEWSNSNLIHTLKVDGNNWTLGVERNATSVLRMGEPFQTCLSPGDINFFSAVSNLVDINKQALFLRDARGVIQGRCLCVLNEDFNIVIFHPYAHRKDIDFKAVVKSFVSEWSERVGCKVSPGGKVQNLVSKDWYDDGAVDLHYQLDLRQEGSNVRREVSECPVGGLKNIINKYDIEHDRVFLYQLVFLPEFSQRTDLVPELIDLVKDIEWKDIHALSQLGALCVSARISDKALEFFRTACQASLKWRDEWDSYVDYDLANGLLDLGRFSEALRFLKKKRPYGTSSFEEERDQARTKLVARALEGLGRTHQADTLCSKLLKETS